MKQEENKKTEKKQKEIVSARGRIFKGLITKKFAKRVVVELERTVFVRKYESFYKSKTRLHARIPEGMELEVGDLVLVRECRPLSKIINFIVIKKAQEESK